MTKESKTIAESRVQLIQLMGPEHANALGNVHGGNIMKLVDEAGALAAMRHAQAIVVTVTIDSMTFREPIFVGNVVTAEAELTYVGNTSIEVHIEVSAENPLTGVKTSTNSAYVVYVALDGQGHPRSVPKLIATTPDEEEIMREAAERQAYRKAQQVRQSLRRKTAN